MEHNNQPIDLSLQTLIEQRVEKMLTPLERFIRKQAAASILLVLATLIALFLANSPWDYVIHSIAAIETGIHFNHWHFSFPIKSLINEGLLTLFFLLIGMEVKREIMIGQLRKPRQVVLILSAALGGMVVPALIYTLINYHSTGQSGWAIPMATDTAFAIGILAILARYVSVGASIFLAALAIFDDIGAILVIAIFYTKQLDIAMLLYAIIPLMLLFAVNFMGIRSGWIYAVIGLVLWWCIQVSGIHATLAGILMAMAITARSRISQRSFIDRIRKQVVDLEEGDKVDNDILKSQEQHLQVSHIGDTVHAASTPLQHWSSLLDNPIAIFVLPLFALFNAGMFLSSDALTIAVSSNVTVGIIAGLVIGKPLGITVFSLAALQLSAGTMPTGMRFVEIIGAGLLAGIGFTMSLFITTLGFEGHTEHLEPAKIGILIASALSATLGTGWLLLTRNK